MIRVRYFYLAQGMDKADDYEYAIIPDDVTDDQAKELAMDMNHEKPKNRQWVKGCLQVKRDHK